MENNLSLALSDSISDEVGAVATDLLEVGLDAIMDDGLLKEVPVISTAVSLYKIGNSIKERHQLKKLASFVVALNNGIADEEKRAHYKNTVKDDPKRRDKELEYIVILIDRYIHSSKAALLAKLFLAYLDERISWVEFTKYAEVLDRLLPGDLELLLGTFPQVFHQDKIGDSAFRVSALGLISPTENNSLFVEDGRGGFSVTLESMERVNRKETVYGRTEFGQVLARILQ